MTKVNGLYRGNLRCELVHEQSSTKIITDAPTDNNGKGESFSPTDLVAAALGSCMVTVIAIRAATKKIDIEYPSFVIVKSMNSNPRNIKQVEVEIKISASIDEGSRVFLEQEARNCPVALSLSKDLVQKINFKYV